MQEPNQDRWAAAAHDHGPRPVGVEEELLLVDPVTGVPVPLAADALRGPTDDGTAGPGGEVEHELQLEQIETATRPCTDLDDLRTQLLGQRALAVEAGERAGAGVAALGVSPVEVDPTTTPVSRYGQMVRTFGQTGAEQLTCGMHVHVQVESAELAVGVLDRIRGWLPVVLAISAGSPFHQGRDTGYASFRSQLQGRWPTNGPFGLFGDLRTYRETVDAMVASGAVLDEGMVYLDARVSARYPTVEVRVADVCTHLDDALLVAALSRGLVETAVREVSAGVEPTAVRTELLRLSSWRAGRSGLGDQLVHPTALRPVPAWEAVQALVDHVHEALDDLGDLEQVAAWLAALRTRGTGAVRQREVLERSGRLADVVRDAVELTRAGV